MPIKKNYESQSNLFTKKFGSLSSRFFNLLIVGADLVVSESAFHAGAILVLRVNFLTFVLLYSTYNLYSAFLVMSDLVGVKNLANFKSYTLGLSHLRIFRSLKWVNQALSVSLCSPNPLRYLSV